MSDDKTSSTSDTEAAVPYDHLIRVATRGYLRELDPQDPPPPTEVAAVLVQRTNAEIISHNKETGAKGNDRYLRLKTLTTTQIGEILLHLHRVVRIAPPGMTSDPTQDIVAIYQPEGVDEGIYVCDDTQLRRLAREYNYSLSSHDFNEIKEVLADSAPRVSPSSDRDLVAVNNGVFDYASKRLLPFSPEMVFTSKSHVDWVQDPPNPVIHNDVDGTDWDVESWMDEISEDPEVVQLLWEIMSAVVRPNVGWDKVAWFYSTVGSNGKGTLLALIRNLCGDRAWTSIPIEAFARDFTLEPLIRASAVLTDENDVDGFVDRAANFKAVITNDVIQINRKHKSVISYQFRGFMVQCVNETPRFKDRTGSFYRRQLIVPFERTFTGTERTYIKHDYVARPEVLQYVLHKVLSGSFYRLSEPEACRQALEDYKSDNDPVRGFYEEFYESFVWNLLPWGFLYDLYKAWFAYTNPSGSALGRKRFITHSESVFKDPAFAPASVWASTGKTAQRTAGRISNGEPLAVEYGLTSWTGTAGARGSSTVATVPRSLPVSTRGLMRLTTTLSVPGRMSGSTGASTPESNRKEDGQS